MIISLHCDSSVSDDSSDSDFDSSSNEPPLSSALNVIDCDCFNIELSVIDSYPNAICYVYDIQRTFTSTLCDSDIDGIILSICSSNGITDLQYIYDSIVDFYPRYDDNDNQVSLSVHSDAHITGLLISIYVQEHTELTLCFESFMYTTDTSHIVSLQYTSHIAVCDNNDGLPCINGTQIPTYNPSSVPTRPNAFKPISLPFTTKCELDVMFHIVVLVDKSCGLNKNECNIYHESIALLLHAIKGANSIDNILITYIEYGSELRDIDVMLNFDDTEYQRSLDKFVEFVTDTNCGASEGNIAEGQTDLLIGLIFAMQMLNTAVSHSQSNTEQKIIVFSNCENTMLQYNVRKQNMHICDTIPGMLSENNIDIVFINAAGGSRNNQIKDIYRYKQCLVSTIETHICVAHEFSNDGFIKAIDQCLPVICSPSNRHTRYPTLQPSESPWITPTFRPTKPPTVTQSLYPSTFPTKYPSLSPTNIPTKIPSHYPSINPTLKPSTDPTSPNPTINPTTIPTMLRSNHPSITPTNVPTTFPSYNPSLYPTINPNTDQPSQFPTNQPSQAPIIIPTENTSTSPTTTGTTVQHPTTEVPTNKPTPNPTLHPITSSPSNNPSISPTNLPSLSPTPTPNIMPSQTPSIPTLGPAEASLHPTTERPSASPSNNPSTSPSIAPSDLTDKPTMNPSPQPTPEPTPRPTKKPTESPTIPTSPPTQLPTQSPTPNPTPQPTPRPRDDPTIPPTHNPTMGTTSTSFNPSESLTSSPLHQPTDTPSLFSTSCSELCDAFDIEITSIEPDVIDPTVTVYDYSIVRLSNEGICDGNIASFVLGVCPGSNVNIIFDNLLYYSPLFVGVTNDTLDVSINKLNDTTNAFGIIGIQLDVPIINNLLFQLGLKNINNDELSDAVAFNKNAIEYVCEGDGLPCLTL